MVRSDWGARKSDEGQTEVRRSDRGEAEARETSKEPEFRQIRVEGQIEGR